APGPDGRVGAVAVTHAKAPGPPVWASVLLAVAGVVVGVVAIAFLVVGVASEVTAPAHLTPNRFETHLGGGQYLVYVSSVEGQFGAADVQVMAAGGGAAPLLVEPYSGNETMTRNGTVYDAELSFSTPGAGEYVVTIGQ